MSCEEGHMKQCRFRTQLQPEASHYTDMAEVLVCAMDRVASLLCFEHIDLQCPIVR